MDYIRRPYATLARFFADDEGPPVQIQWYAAAADAPTLGRGTSFMSLDWTSSTDNSINKNWPDEPWLQRPGEIFEAARPFSLWPTPLGLDYAHVCGTDAEFIDGAVFDSDLEVKYDEQGLPLCCNGPIVPAIPLVIGFDGDLEQDDPGDACATAQVIGLGEGHEFDIAPGGVQFWRIDGLSGVTYSVKLLPGTTLSTDLRGIYAWAVTPCFVPGTVFNFDTATFSPCFNTTNSVSPPSSFVIAFANFGSVVMHYKFRVDLGAC